MTYRSWKHPLQVFVLGLFAAMSVSTPTGLSLDLAPSETIRVINVRDFGAKGDGVTDDRVAITAAMTFACALSAPATIYFPPGTYPVSRNGTNFYSLNIPCGNLTLQGDRRASVIMQPSGMPNAPVTIIQITEKNKITIRDLIIDGNWQNAVGYVAATSDSVALPQATINLDDASLFPVAGGTFTVMTRQGPTYIQCTGHTATSLTGCSGGTGTLYARMTIGYVDGQAGINMVTQSTADTTVAAGSSGATLPTPTINVASTTGFSLGAGGTINLITNTTNAGWQRVTCTVVNPTSFGGCSCTNTGVAACTGTLFTNAEIYAPGVTQGRNPGIGVAGGTDIDIINVLVRRIYGDCYSLGGATDHTWAQNIRLIRADCFIASRDGVAIDSAVRGISVENSRFTSAQAQAFDSEPVWWPVRDVVLKDSYLGGWWNNETVGAQPLSIVGSSSASQTISTDARNWRVSSNTIEGSAIIGNVTDVVFEHNRVIEDFQHDTPSPIEVSGFAQDLTIRDNYVYTRSITSGTDGQSDCCGILITSFVYSGGDIAAPTSVHVYGNDVHVRNGRWGISLIGAGQGISSTSGTATAVTTTTLTDGAAAWVVNQWTGAIVYVGAASATVVSNTATVLTLNAAFEPGSSAWMTSLGNQMDTPALGAYKISFATGTVDVHDNYVEASGNDGWGKGKYCYNVSPGNSNAITTRVRIHHNVAKDCDTYGYFLGFNLTTAFPYVEITNNIAYDDQATSTTTNVLGFLNAIKATKLVIGGNIAGAGVTATFSGLSAGTWLVQDGMVQMWAGFGAPGGVVVAPVGSLYQRLDGGAASTLYVKESGSGTSAGWVAK